MATTESRSGFRLPWSADRAPLRDGSEGYPESDFGDGDSAADMEATEARAPEVDVESGPGTANLGAAREAVGQLPDAAPAPSANPARRPTKFLVDMIHAMQAAAEQARTATLEQFRVEGSSYVEQIQGRSVADADALRRRADEDVASIKDWSKAEIARIRDDTENRVAGRRGQLDGQLARHAALVERDVARIEGQIASFEAQMATFFDELLAETDLTILAAHAQQMPEAPAFDELDGDAFTALLTETAVGIPPAAPIAEPVTAAQPEPAVAAPAEPEPAAHADAPTAGAISTTDASGSPADAGDSPDAATAEMAHADAPADTAAAKSDVASPTVANDVRPALDPRLAMLGLTPDFAAAEAAAAEAAAAEIQDIPELDEQNLAARLAGLIPPSSSGATADAVPAVPVVTTQVIVTGLISVASIASFKRHLSREAGVRHVGVSSGPDGEFLFTVQHEGAVSLRDLIPALPGFQARVTGGGDGVVTASAHDPED